MPVAQPDPNAALDLGVSTNANPSQGPIGDDDSTRIPTKPEWPWRHVIHVADTVPLSENRLRYYDHPVIKVLAIWRELSWYEVFRQGKDTLDASKEPLSNGVRVGLRRIEQYGSGRKSHLGTMTFDDVQDSQ